MRNKLLLSAVLTSFLGACGADFQAVEPEDGEGEEGATSFEGEDSIVSDDELNQEGMSAGLTDLIEALGDTNADQSSSSLALVGITDNSSYSKSCEEEDEGAEDDVAVVTIDRDIDRSFVLNGRRRQIERQVTGSGDIVRTWSMGDEGVDCAENGRHADIDWSADIAGLSVDVTVNRSRKVEMTYTNKRRGNSFERTREFSAEGTRSVDWTGHASDTEENTVTRRKTITSSILRKHKRANSRGKEKELELSVKTQDDAPVVVEVVRDLTTMYPKSKTVESGVLELTRNDDGRLELTFEDLKAVFSDDSCSFESGRVDFALYKADSEEASRNFSLVFEDGEYTLTDTDSGDEFSDFEFEDCNIRDFIRD